MCQAKENFSIFQLLQSSRNEISNVIPVSVMGAALEFMIGCTPLGVQI